MFNQENYNSLAVSHVHWGIKAGTEMRTVEGPNA